jgi:hypothetical protein
MIVKTSSKVRHQWSIVIGNERKHMLKSAFTVFPESSVKTAWDVVGFLFIII